MIEERTSDGGYWSYIMYSCLRFREKINVGQMLLFLYTFLLVVHIL